ncbi:uncharacterized protein LOC129223029 [Uloborus diversus]|uniref:uncharacterized protein LOC129223029 n=1 Tax=Uloborus diversus TaxID=327109 RepID=UPI00240A9185|nr:uncharacterized protein LOC129223029 [Uloborus diversus]
MAVDCKLNIIVLGDSGVGKTSLLLRFTTQTFKEFQTSTIIDCLHKQMNIEGKEVKLDLWDTAGQDRYRTLTKSYYRMADGVILVYDVGNIVSFSKLTSWLQELRGMNENAAIVIVGNKTDNLNRRAVTLQAVESYAKEEKLPFIETSAKNGNNVNTNTLL